MKEFFQSIYDSYSDRIKNPFVGSFILSFLIFNWRAISILLYSDWPIHCRIEWIENRYCKWENFYWPVIIALFYILILPYINLCFEWLLILYSDKKQSKSDIKRDSDLERRLKEAAILKKIADIEAGTSQINELNVRNETLQSQISELNNQLEEESKRHTRALELAKNKEYSINDEIKALSMYSKQGWAKDLKIDLSGITLPMIKEVIKIANDFKENGQKKFLDFVVTLDADMPINNIYDLPKYEELGLIEPYLLKGKNKTHLTRKGLLLTDYLNQGLELM